jgi:hypothetical protein
MVPRSLRKRRRPTRHSHGESNSSPTSSANSATTKNSSSVQLLDFIRFAVSPSDTDDGSGSGSDSNPSEDNLDPKEMMSIMPQELQLEVVKEEPSAVKKLAPKPIARPAHVIHKHIPKLGPDKQRLEESRKEALRRAQRMAANVRRDRHNLVQYIEMVDACTQTSFHEEPYILAFIYTAPKSKAKPHLLHQPFHPFQYPHQDLRRDRDRDRDQGRGRGRRLDRSLKHPSE